MLTEQEIRRQVFHLVSGVFFVFLIYVDLLGVISASLLLSVVLMVCLIGKKFKVPLLYKLFLFLDRPADIKKLPGKGSIFFLIGIVVSLIAFEKDIAMASIVILAVGDSIAPLVGQFGTMKHPINNKKYVEGVLAGGFLAFLAAVVFVNPLEAALGSIFAMLAEGIDLKIGVKKIDDNIVMPIVAGIVIWFIRYIL